jgi:hypothetical protein
VDNGVAFGLGTKVKIVIGIDRDNRMIVFAKIFRAGKDVGVNLGRFVKMKFGLQGAKGISQVFVKRATHNIVNKVIDVIFNLTPFDLSLVFGHVKEHILIQDSGIQGFDFTVFPVLAKNTLINFNFCEMPFSKNHLIGAFCIKKPNLMTVV